MLDREASATAVRLSAASAQSAGCGQAEPTPAGAGGLLVQEGPDSRRRARLVTATGQGCSSAGHRLRELAVHQSQDATVCSES